MTYSNIDHAIIKKKMVWTYRRYASTMSLYIRNKMNEPNEDFIIFRYDRDKFQRYSARFISYSSSVQEQDRKPNFWKGITLI